MPLDTTVEGDPATFDAVRDWVRKRQQETDRVAEDFIASRGQSEDSWGESAGEAFRGLAQQGVSLADGVTDAAAGLVSILETHEWDLREVRKMMGHARDVAREGGLELRGNLIMEPGAAPPAVRPLPGDRPASSEERAARGEAQQAQADYQRKMQAYTEAAQIVQDAKKQEKEAQTTVMRFFSDTFDPGKLSITLSDMSTGAAAAVAVRTSAYQKAAAEVKSTSLPSRMAAQSSMSPWGRFKAAQMAANRSIEKLDNISKAYATAASRVIARSPPWVQKAIKVADKKIIPEPQVKPSSAILRGGAKVAGKLPWAGVFFTSLGVGYDVNQGKDPTQAVVSNTSGFVVGSVVGGAIGGPLGVVVGGLVGVGVGFAVDEIWSAAD